MLRGGDERVSCRPVPPYERCRPLNMIAADDRPDAKEE
jgi:hypothetical protein